MQTMNAVPVGGGGELATTTLSILDSKYTYTQLCVYSHAYLGCDMETSVVCLPDALALHL